MSDFNNKFLNTVGTTVSALVRGQINSLDAVSRIVTAHNDSLAVFREQAAASVEVEWANGSNGLTRFEELAYGFGKRAAEKIRALPAVEGK